MQFSNINYNLYKSFLVVYETKNISRAADLLYISQPAVSHNIKELEKHQILENTLKEVNVTYIVINKDDFEGLTHPKHPVNIVDLFNFKLGLDEE